jgi:hypothetical protein
MRIDNRTRWDTAALRTLIEAALHDAGVKPGHDTVRIVYSKRGNRNYTGWCYRGEIIAWNGRYRMHLSIPKPTDDNDTLNVRQFAFLVRHEVAHWAGLRHRQMRGALMMPPKPDEPIQAWVPEGWGCLVGPEPVKAPLDREAERAERRAELEAAAARWNRKLALAKTKAKLYERKLKAHDAYTQRAACKGQKT